MRLFACSFVMVSKTKLGFCFDRSSFDGTSRLWDSMSGDCLRVFEGNGKPLYSLRFSGDGRWFATGSGDGWVHVYDVKVRKWITNFETAKRAVGFSGEGKEMVVVLRM
jgi:WD40 repeat protein